MHLCEVVYVAFQLLVGAFLVAATLVASLSRLVSSLLRFRLRVIGWRLSALLLLALTLLLHLHLACVFWRSRVATFFTCLLLVSNRQDRHEVTSFLFAFKEESERRGTRHCLWLEFIHIRVGEPMLVELNRPLKILSSYAEDCVAGVGSLFRYLLDELVINMPLLPLVHVGF